MIDDLRGSLYNGWPGLHNKVMRIDAHQSNGGYPISDLNFCHIYVYIYTYHAYNGVPASVMHMLPCNF